MHKKLCLLLLTFVMPYFAIDASSEFVRGYVYSKLDDSFPDIQLDVDSETQTIIVYDWAFENEYDIRYQLECQFPNYTIQFNCAYQSGGTDCPMAEELALVGSFEAGGFLPELSPFFPTMLAQPHLLGYSAGYRSYDKVFKSSIPVSIGDQFSLYQFNIHSNAKLFLGIEACVWAIFKAKTQSLSLINADYYVSFPLTYIYNRFAAKLRFFHESSHLGDEFLLETPNIVRVNPSMEGVDLSLSYEPLDRLVLFGGYTNIFRSDDSFNVKPNSFYWGFNYFLDFAKIPLLNVEAIPYVAGFFNLHENNNWGLDSSVAIGYQWNKCYGHKFRIYVVGHDGYSAEGQFARKRSKYVSINLLYGY